MHRLLKFSGTPLHNYQQISFSKFSENWNRSMTEKTCLLCKRPNISGSQVRLQSTNINPNLLSKKPKKRKKTKKSYVELLVVRPNSTSQQKVTIKKLTSSDLKLLASTNLNLSELYKLKELSKTPISTLEEHTYNNLNIIGNIPDTNSESKIEFMNLNVETSSEKFVVCEIPSLTPPKIEIPEVNNILPKVEDVIEYEECESEQPDHRGSLHPAVIEEHIPDVTEVKEDIDKPAKSGRTMITNAKYWEEITARTLASYIEVCCHLRNPQRGLNALHFYRGRSKNNYVHNPVVNSIKVYNAVLKGFAHKGDFSKIEDVLSIMQEEQVKLNIHSYIAIFECLGRVNFKDSHLREIRKYGKEALLKGFMFNQMMNQGCFLNDEREMVLKSIQAYNPEYMPQYDDPTVWYNNHLVNHLNHDSQKYINEIEYKSNLGLFTPEKLKECVEKQIKLEKSGYVEIKSIEYRGPVSEEVQRYRKTLEEHYKMWEKAALIAFMRDLSTLSAQRSANNMEPYLRSIPVKDFITIIIEEAKKIAQGSETYSPTVKMLYKDLGSRVYARYLVLRKQKTGVLDKIIDIHNSYCHQYAALHSKLDVLPDKECMINPRQIWQWAEYKLKDQGAAVHMDHQVWVPTTLQFIGKFLYHIIMHDLKVDVNGLRNSQHKNYLPAFYTIFRSEKRQTKEEVKPHPILSKLYRNSLPETLDFPTYELPMVCPPVPWTSWDMGGYLVSPCELVRLPYQATTQKNRLAEAGAQQLYPCLDALNQLAAVPWKVNQRVLDVVLEVFNSGGSSNLNVPKPPTSLTPPPQFSNELDKADRYQLFKQKMQYRRKKAEMYSLWCDCLYRLSLANHFRDDIFWLPHNMDFRGRVYPVPPHLNHLGSDLARSMLIFAEPRPLGPDGLDWLKIHLVNLTGLKKRDPLSERLAYANQIMHLIFDSADRPLTGKKWWAESDEPWQTLACCMEIADVVRSPDPEGYMSYFPVHQDGSCNGLQHYAALGRDASGAYSVNLANSDVPQDIYSAVVALVEEQRAKDAENGIEIAKTLAGFVKRKVIKQTIMTTVYGVTRFGARLQIARQLKDIEDFPKEAVWGASHYLTVRTFDSLRTMFTSTREIQDWFTECARFISSIGARYMEWVTPLGLPIVQPYFKFKYNSTQEGFAMDTFEKPNVLKQKNAFPPNFIHSLDSSHMMLTSLHCERAGITFVSVHDCFWTHPSTVEIMNKICREQFVALHSEPILTDLSRFLVHRYSFKKSDFTGDGSVSDLSKKKLNRILRQLPKTGDFDINQVLKSVYFFS